LAVPQVPSGETVPLACVLVVVLVLVLVVVVVLEPVPVVVVVLWVPVVVVVLVLVLVVLVLVLVVLVLLELLELLDTVPVRDVRYQLAGGSPRHVPTVTAAKLLGKPAIRIERTHR
jgi:hypothetical protein